MLCIGVLANKPNHLAGQTSPYLKQHLYNKVDWYPWCKKAFYKAKKEHKMIFLSIGYSTCHWCHVMEQESFNNTTVAKLLNKYFISIKVDKEEMPQVDKKFQKIYQKLYKKNGGWPLNIFLTEEFKPFYIGKYIPVYEGYGSPGLIKLLTNFSNLYKKDKNSIYTLANKIAKETSKQNLSQKIIRKNIIEVAIANIKNNFDKTYKGFGKGAKYPESSKIDLLLDYWKVYKDKDSLSLAIQTLYAMQKSSIYDIISGGFFRYTTDRKWKSPHFEKMLYTNAQIISSYIKAYNITNIRAFKNVIKKSIDEIDKHFKNSKGLYFSASDANSNRIEGGYYIFKYQDILNKLLSKGVKKEDAVQTLKYLDIQKDGNYDSEYALPFLKGNKKPKNFNKIVKIIQAIKERRKFPFIDKKIITSWNTMMIKAKIQASFISPSYLNEGLKSLNNLLFLMQKSNHDLYHQVLDGKIPTQCGLLEDYAYLVDTLLSAYNFTLNNAYLKKAYILNNIAINKFYKDGKWYLSNDKITLADGDDTHYTSPLSIMLKDILRLATLKSSLKLKDIFKNTIFSFKHEMINKSKEYAQMIDNLLRYQKGIIVLKSSKNNLLKYKKKISLINYPFLLKEVAKTKQFLSCDLKSCFAYGDFKTVKEKIEQY